MNYINIAAFGAVGDGATNNTDNSSALQAALDFIAANPWAPRRIYYPPAASWYAHSQPSFDILGGVTIFGDVAHSGPTLANTSHSWIGQTDFSKSHPWLVVTANNGITAGGTGTDGPLIFPITSNGGTVYYAQLNPSLFQLDGQGIHLSDTDVGDWQGLTAFTVRFWVYLWDGIPHNQTGYFILTSAGTIDQHALSYHPTLRLCIDNVGTDGLTTQNGVWVQLQTAGTQNGNGFSGGVIATSNAASLPLNTPCHVQVVYDGAHLTISINGAVNGTPVAVTGAIQQQWYEQARIGGQAGNFLLPGSQSSTLTGNSGNNPNIRIGIGSISMLNYALPTTYTTPVGEDPFINASGSNVTMWYVSFNPANRVNPPNHPDGSASPLNGAIVGWYKGLSSYHTTMLPRATTGSPVYFRWRGTMGGEYIGGEASGVTIEGLSFGNQPNNGAPWCQAPIVTGGSLYTTIRRCTFGGMCGPFLDVFSYNATFEDCKFENFTVPTSWKRAWGAQLGVGTQFTRFVNCSNAGASFGVIASWGTHVIRGFWNHASTCTIAFGGGTMKLDGAEILDDGGGSVSIAQVLALDGGHLEISGGYMVAFGAAADVPTIAMSDVPRASIRTMIAASSTAGCPIAILDSLPANIIVEADSMLSTSQGMGNAAQGGAMRVNRLLYASYDCSAGGAIAIAIADFWAETIVLTGTPAAAFQIQLPMMFRGAKIRFVNQTGQTATVYTQAQTWTANTKYGGHACITPSTPNGKWYRRNTNDTVLANLLGVSTAYEGGAAVISSGVSGPVEPTWGTTTGGPTGDGQTSTNKIGVVGCWWFCMGNVGAASSRQAGNGATVPPSTTEGITIFCNGLGWGPG